MIFIKYYAECDFDVPDRRDLVYSPIIGAFDFIDNSGLLCAWAFMFDNEFQTRCYGRSIDDFEDLLETLKSKLFLSEQHKLIIFVDDLSTLFWLTHKQLRFSEETVARSKRQIMLCNWDKCVEFHSFSEYYEENINRALPKILGVMQPSIMLNGLSDSCTLMESELEYLSNRIEFISYMIRSDLDSVYEGEVRKLPLTKTARISRIFDAEKRKQANKSNCNINNQLLKANPLSSEEGRAVILPLLKKAFFGGISFMNEDYRNNILENVAVGDFTSAYISQMITKKYPLSRFEPMPIPATLSEFNSKKYASKALLITFEAKGVELRKNGVAFLPSETKHQWIDIDDNKEMIDLGRMSSKQRIESAATLRLTLTDIDFHLFAQNYSCKEIKILSVHGARYGYLPDFIISVLIRLYRQKADAKDFLNQLIAAGEADEYSYIDYNDIKSIPARVYGIFTKSPVVEKFAFDPEKKQLKIVDPNFVSINSKFSSVLYQWGVWTTAHVRKELLGLRRQLLPHTPVFYGDTDSLAFRLNPFTSKIIAQYNEGVKVLVARRAASFESNYTALRDLGNFELKKYKYFRYTSLKQYAYIYDAEDGEHFEFRAAGLSKECKYFASEAKKPYAALCLFAVGTTIPAEYAPRKAAQYVDIPKTLVFTDRDGNLIKRDIKSYINVFADKFSLGGFDAAELPRAVSGELGTPTDIDNLRAYSRKINGLKLK